MARYHLGQDFKTDTLHLRFESMAHVTLPAGEDTAFWLSLSYALLEGASLALEIGRRALDGVVRPFRIDATIDPEANYSQEIVRFDNVPGGAGHVRNIANHLAAVLRRALAVAQCTECAAETSCNSCSRNYDNQIYWNQLQRRPVALFLELLAETFPDDLEHLAAEEQRSGPQYYQTFAEQRQLFARLQQDFPQLALLPRLERQLPHDRFLELTRADGTRARIGIGVGLDFIQPNGRARATDILIEDPFDKK